MSDTRPSAFRETAIVENPLPRPEERSADELYQDVLETRRRLTVAVDAARARGRAMFRPLLLGAAVVATVTVVLVARHLLGRRRR